MNGFYENAVPVSARFSWSCPKVCRPAICAVKTLLGTSAKTLQVISDIYFTFFPTVDPHTFSTTLAKIPKLCRKCQEAQR